MPLGSFARRKRPPRNDFMFVRVDHRNFALVFDVAVNATCRLIHRCEFGTSTELNRCNYGRAFRVNHRDRISGMIENVNLVAIRFVNDQRPDLAPVSIFEIVCNVFRSTTLALSSFPFEENPRCNSGTATNA